MVPVVSVADLPVSLRHYVEVLGFAVEWSWSEAQGFDAPAHATFGCVRRGECAFFLCEGGQGSPGSWMCLNVCTRDELDALFAEYRNSGAKIIEPPTEQPWGMVEMLVEDLDGNTFRMGTPSGVGGLQ